jgi:hypothetical protein
MAHTVVETSTIRKSQDIHAHPYINQYELIAALGEGMHGRVMLARDGKTQERVVRSSFSPPYHPSLPPRQSKS